MEINFKLKYMENFNDFIAACGKYKSICKVLNDVNNQPLLLVIEADNEKEKFLLSLDYVAYRAKTTEAVPCLIRWKSADYNGICASFFGDEETSRTLIKPFKGEYLAAKKEWIGHNLRFEEVLSFLMKSLQVPEVLI